VSIVVLTAIGGAFLLVLLLLQIAIGERWLKLGRNHLKIHRALAWLILAVALGHGGVAFYVFVLPLV
jgi:hypothetical protein